MGTWLRLSLVLVTLGLLYTLAELGHEDSSDRPSALGTLLKQLPHAMGGEASGVRQETTGPSAMPDRSGEDVQPVYGETGSARQEFNARPLQDIRLASVDDLVTVQRSPDQFDLIVRNRDIHYVFNLLNSTGKIKIVALPSVKGSITITLYNVTVERALDAILKTQGYLSRSDGDYTLVYTQEDLEVLDPQAGKIEVLTYKPKYISAVDLIQILTPHLTEKGKISSTKANQAGIAANGDNAGGDSLAVDDAIVVQDIRAAIERVQRIIRDIDIRPEQVLIEAVLLSVQLDDEHHLGVNFSLLDNAGANLAVVGNGSVLNGAVSFPPATLLSGAGRVQGAFATNEHGLKYGVINGNYTSFFNLLETIGQTTVLASPKVLALNKQRAEIIVGSQLGYRTVTTTETAAVENVQFLDVGTQLRMRPFVQQDGYIRMELHPEKSSGRVNEATGLPEKETTQVTTNLTVRSGETIVIGGLIQEQQQRAVQQIPYLGSLPVIGRLFRDETTSVNRQEIIVLITPTIINDDDEYCGAADDVAQFADRRDSLERSMPSYTRVALARTYFEQACACRDAGQLDQAAILIARSIYFDPTYEAALRLRSSLGSAVHESGPSGRDMAPLVVPPAGTE